MDEENPYFPLIIVASLEKNPSKARWLFKA